MLSKHYQRKFNEYVDFETRVLLLEAVNPKGNKSLDKYFLQIGKRLAEIRGLDKRVVGEMVNLTKEFSHQNLFEFAKRLVGLTSQGLLTMQQVLALESEFNTRAITL